MLKFHWGQSLLFSCRVQSECTSVRSRLSAEVEGKHVMVTDMSEQLQIHQESFAELKEELKKVSHIFLTVVTVEKYFLHWRGVFKKCKFYQNFCSIINLRPLIARKVNIQMLISLLIFFCPVLSHYLSFGTIKSWMAIRQFYNLRVPNSCHLWCPIKTACDSQYLLNYVTSS